MVVQPTETMNTQTDVTIITEVVTALEGTDKDKSMKSSSMDADTAGKLTEETMTSKPATRIETSASFMDTNESPTATNESPMATNELPTATNESPMATNESPMATNELPTATNESPMATNESPMATNELPTATNESPMATNESPMATNEFSRATNESPMATNESPMATNELPMTTNESPMATNESPMDISLSSLATIVTIDTTDETFTMEVTKAVPEDDAEVTTVDLVKDVTDEDGIEHVVTTEPAHVIETTLVYAPASRDTRSTGAPMLLHTTLVPETTSSMMTTSEVSTTADVTTRDTTTGESTTDNVYGETETPDNSTALIEDKTIASIRVAISIYGEEFDEALTDTSTIEFMIAAQNWKERVSRIFI
ncbi:surface protein-like [Lytechinus variegatus]|uniref:surface protein-like n=1 Tax=Lytechinus variegatus TaxID=7654 RepID=UPI001BB2A902|nr:surface protein-like [Lytechinus variegatus]